MKSQKMAQFHDVINLPWLMHNHPSGVAEPSEADRGLTQRLRDALGLVDIRVLDHFVIGEGEPVSFAERGLL